MRHSELKNTEDLHFSRLRVFSGNPDTVVPDFVDQILTNSSNNRVYRATGTNAGQLVELVPQVEQRVIFDETFPEPTSQTQLLVRVDQNRIYRANGILPSDWLEIVGADGGGNGSGSSAISVGNNPPQNAPTALGEQYFDSRSNNLFIAIDDGGALGWRSSIPKIKSESYSVNYDTSNFPDLSINETWLYTEQFPDSISSIYFDGNEINTNLADIAAAIEQYGAGCYFLYFEIDDPNNALAGWDLSTSCNFITQGYSSSYSPDSSSFVVPCSYNGKSSDGFFISPDRRLGATATYTSNLTFY